MGFITVIVSLAYTYCFLLEGMGTIAIVISLFLRLITVIVRNGLRYVASYDKSSDVPFNSMNQMLEISDYL